MDELTINQTLSGKLDGRNTTLFAGTVQMMKGRTHKIVVELA